MTFECKTATTAIVVVKVAFFCKIYTHLTVIEESDIHWDKSTLVEPILARKLFAETAADLAFKVTVFPPVEIACICETFNILG
jgi:hypothetical protein